MDNELVQMIQGFFDEALELLNEVEKVAISLNIESYTDDEINQIFRCMHSIKGGAGALDFKDINSFTHSAETYLDLVRNHKRKLNDESLSILLSVIDLVKGMIYKHKGDNSISLDEMPKILKKIEDLINENELTQVKTQKVVEEDFEALFDEVQKNATPTAPDYHWEIIFVPKENLFETDCDLKKLFNELNKIGTAVILAEYKLFPNWDDFNPRCCYLQWKINLKTMLDEKTIFEDIFSWVAEKGEVLFKPKHKDVILRVEENTSSKPSFSVTHPINIPEVEKIESKSSPRLRSKTDDSHSEASSIRVSTDKIDVIINLVGELVITKAIFEQAIKNFELVGNLQKVRECALQFENNIRDLQEKVMRIRMLPISNVFSRFPRIVRDMNLKLKKKVELKLLGDTTELDKTVLEKIGDPLVHLVRNCLDHGIELPEVRAKKGKPELGVLQLHAYHLGSNIIIEITDDGAGLNEKKILEKALSSGLINPSSNLSSEEIWNLIFLPGFSTAEIVTDVSGRGVGMDVVKKNIESVNGSVALFSQPNKGTKFTISLPLTLSIINGQIIKACEHIFIVPLISIKEIIQIDFSKISHIKSNMDVYILRDDYIPIIYISDYLCIKRKLDTKLPYFLLVVESGENKYGIFIDDLLFQQQVVIKNIEQNYQHVNGVAGATVLGDGSVAMILDVSFLIQFFINKDNYAKQKGIA